MVFYASCGNIKPMETEENHGTYYIRKDITYNEDEKLYEYQETMCTKDEYDIYILNQRQLEALEALTELYELLTGGE